MNECDLIGCYNRDELKKCSRCKRVYYCSRECQRKDWSVHKTRCFDITQDQNDLQQLVIENGTLKLNFINPRNDRSLEIHGSDTRPLKKIKNKTWLKMFKYLKLENTKPVSLKYDENFKGTGGLPIKNVELAIANSGEGEYVYGWNLFAGQYMIEVEAGCV
jgi:hypothetical protein